jgi:phosphatidylserine/phosphatidylglycerophosphate/cardiolipin synthase-like enzyme
MKNRNLNSLKALRVYFEHSRPKETTLRDNYVRAVSEVEVEAYFKRLEEALVEKIATADAVVGCVAWLTSEPVIGALAARPNGVSILIQKEEFLRPDIGDTRGFPARLRKSYAALPSINPPVDGWNEPRDAEIGSGSYVDLSVRCIGFGRRKNEITLPRMHHKFLVFCRSTDFDESKTIWPYEPFAVWTGSFNMTRNGTMSLENAVFIRNYQIAEAYFSEWDSLLMVSEQLDWSSVYANPDIQFNDGAVYS